MRAFSGGLADHLQRQTTTLCNCWIVRRRDGVVLGFTDHDADLTVNGVICRASSGFEPAEAVAQLGLATDGQDVEGALSSQSISEEDIAAGRYDDARIEVWLVNWYDPDQRHHMRTAVLGEITREDDLFRAELRGLSALLDQPTGRTYAPLCDAVVGDDRCMVDLLQPGLFADAAVDDVRGPLTLVASALAGFAHNWFAGGKITWLTGVNANLTVEVAAGTGDGAGDVTLWQAMPVLPEVGDTFRITAGCNKSFATCKTKFANHLNFRGFPHMPGSDFALGYADRSAVHDGGPLVE